MTNWKVARVVELARLESEYTVTYQGFESLTFLKFDKKILGSLGGDL